MCILESSAPLAHELRALHIDIGIHQDDVLARHPPRKRNWTMKAGQARSRWGTAVAPAVIPRLTPCGPTHRRTSRLPRGPGVWRDVAREHRTPKSPPWNSWWQLAAEHLQEERKKELVNRERIARSACLGESSPPKCGPGAHYPPEFLGSRKPSTPGRGMCTASAGLGSASPARVHRMITDGKGHSLDDSILGEALKDVLDHDGQDPLNLPPHGRCTLVQRRLSPLRQARPPAHLPWRRRVHRQEFEHAWKFGTASALGHGSEIDVNLVWREYVLRLVPVEVLARGHTQQPAGAETAGLDAG
ncbi:hypothetical protein B0H19DRAFT_1064458 [Mycena capillaripes]|nr:hypothetical protein B0H19DRAFT_1064458 [Mycena capillaripes]